MMKLLIKALAAAAAFTMAVTFAGCAAVGQTEQSNESSTLKIGFSQSGTKNQWRVTESNSIIEKAESLGYELLYTDANDSVEQQNEDIMGIVAQGVDYLVITPRDFSGLEEGLFAAKQAGVLVLIIERDINGVAGEDYVTVIKSDLYDEAYSCGKYMAELFEGQRCNIIEIVGSEKSSPSIERAQGFEDAIKEHDNMCLIATGSGNYTRGTARLAIEELIKEKGSDNIDAIFAQNDDTAIDAIAAVEAAGLTAGEDIKIFSNDGSSEALRAIVAGKLVMTVQCTPYYGEIVFQTIEKLEKGRKVPERIKMADGMIYDISNALKILELSGGTY